MNKEELELRITSIRNEMEVIKSNYAKLEGHLQEASHWLTSILNKVTEESIETPTTECCKEESCP